MLRIKEILEALKPHNDIKEYPLTLSIEEQKLLLDYITNLEKENRELKKEIKNLIELCNKYEKEHNTAFKLWTMKMEEMPNYEESISLKQRNEKAIEYISCHFKEMVADEEAQVLLEILKGADK